VVQHSPFLGYTGERKPPAFEARFRLRSWPIREAVSLPRSSALRLNGSEAQQRQPMRMALAGHQFSWAFAGALGNPAAGVVQTWVTRKGALVLLGRLMAR
jgi:hypothetical protein